MAKSYTFNPSFSSILALKLVTKANPGVGSLTADHVSGWWHGALLVPETPLPFETKKKELLDRGKLLRTFED